MLSAQENAASAVGPQMDRKTTASWSQGLRSDIYKHQPQPHAKLSKEQVEANMSRSALRNISNAPADKDAAEKKAAKMHDDTAAKIKQDRANFFKAQHEPKSPAVTIMVKEPKPRVVKQQVEAEDLNVSGIEIRLPTGQRGQFARWQPGAKTAPVIVAVPSTPLGASTLNVSAATSVGPLPTPQQRSFISLNSAPSVDTSEFNKLAAEFDLGAGATSPLSQLKGYSESPVESSGQAAPRLSWSDLAVTTPMNMHSAAPAPLSTKRASPAKAAAQVVEPAPRRKWSTKETTVQTASFVPAAVLDTSVDVKPTEASFVAPTPKAAPASVAAPTPMIARTEETPQKASVSASPPASASKTSILASSIDQLRAQLEAVQSHIQQWPSAQSIKASAVKQALAAMPAPQVITEVVQTPVQLFTGNDELEVKLRAEMAMQAQHMATQVLAEADARAQSSADELATAIASQLVELHATQTAQHQLVDRSLAEMQELMNTATQQQQSDFAPISHSLAHLQTRIALVEAAAENGAQQAHAVQVSTELSRIQHQEQLQTAVAQLNESIDAIREQQSALVSVAQETASSLNAVQSGLLQTNGALDMQHENIQQLCAQATELSEHIDTTRQTLAELEGRHAQLAAEFQAYSASEHSQVEMALNAAVSFGERVAALEVTVKQHHAAQAMQSVQEGHVSESTILTLMQSAQSHADEQANAVFTQLSDKIQQTQADIAADVDANLNEMKDNMSQSDNQLHQTMSRVAEMGQALHAQQQVSAALSDLVASFQSKLVELSSFLQSFEADQAEAESQRTTVLKQDIMSQVDTIIGEQSSMFSAKFDGVAEACQAGLMQLQQQMHDSIQGSSSTEFKSMLSTQNSELQSEINSVAAIAVAARDACASQQQNMQSVMSSTINTFVVEELPEHISKAVQSEHAVWKSEVEQLLAQQQQQKQDKSFDFAPAPSPKALSSSGLMIDHSDDIAALSAAVNAHSQSFTQQMQALTELKMALMAQAAESKSWQAEHANAQSSEQQNTAQQFQMLQSQQQQSMLSFQQHMSQATQSIALETSARESQIAALDVQITERIGAQQKVLEAQRATLHQQYASWTAEQQNALDEVTASLQDMDLKLAAHQAGAESTLKALQQQHAELFCAQQRQQSAHDALSAQVHQMQSHQQQQQEMAISMSTSTSDEVKAVIVSVQTEQSQQRSTLSALRASLSSFEQRITDSLSSIKAQSSNSEVETQLVEQISSVSRAQSAQASEFLQKHSALDTKLSCQAADIESIRATQHSFNAQFHDAIDAFSTKTATSIAALQDSQSVQMSAMQSQLTESNVNFAAFAQSTSDAFVSNGTEMMAMKADVADVKSIAKSAQQSTSQLAARLDALMMQKESQPMIHSAATESSEVSQQMLHQVADMASALAQQRTHLHTSQTRLIEHTQQAITAMESHLMSHMTEVEQNVSTQLMQGAQLIQTAKSEFKELSNSHSSALSALNSRVNDLQTQFSEQTKQRVQPPTPQPSQAVSHIVEVPQTATIDTESIVSTIEQSVIARLDQVDAQLEAHLDAIEANAHAAIREAAQHEVRAVVWPAVQTTIEEMWTQYSDESAEVMTERVQQMEDHVQHQLRQLTETHLQSIASAIEHKVLQSVQSSILDRCVAHVDKSIGELRFAFEQRAAASDARQRATEFSLDQHAAMQQTIISQQQLVSQQMMFQQQNMQFQHAPIQMAMPAQHAQPQQQQPVKSFSTMSEASQTMMPTPKAFKSMATSPLPAPSMSTAGTQKCAEPQVEWQSSLLQRTKEMRVWLRDQSDVEQRRQHIASRLADREKALDERMQQQAQFWAQWRSEEEAAAAKRDQLMQLLRANQNTLNA